MAAQYAVCPVSDSVLHFEGNRVMSAARQRNDTGWNQPAPRRRFEGDSRRHLLATQRLVLRKSA
jgi:hypothetical protein